MMQIKYVKCAGIKMHKCLVGDVMLNKILDINLSGVNILFFIQNFKFQKFFFRFL